MNQSTTHTIEKPAQASPRSHRSKTLAGALALFFGWAGAHRLYLGKRFWWLYPLLALPALGLARAVGGDYWYQQPAYFVAALVAIVALFEAILICLTADAKWDARYNPDSRIKSASGWPVVLVAIAALFLGALLMMSSLAIGLEVYFESIRSRTM